MKHLLKLIIAILIFFSVHDLLSAQTIAAGGWHSIAVCNDSTVKAFGENASGELGNGTTTDQSTPVTVIGLTGIKSVSGGGDQLEAHSLALKSNGTVYAWGSNIYGQLGNATTTSTTAPVQVLILTGAIGISAGGWHSAALKNDGTVWTWGWNTDGQLGDGTFTDKTIPTQVPGLSGVKQIAAGTYHVLALKNDSTVWDWGDNISGQIGDGTTTDRNAPVQVSGLTGVVKIAAGRFFSLAVKNDGTVWTWGENLYGQLGNGSTTDSPVPVQVGGLTGVTTATAATGAFHCMAVKNDNTIWAWGRNSYGNLGDGTTTNSSVPVQMTGISAATGLAAGTNFSLLYLSDGTLWGCGRNASGQLGDGTVLQRNTVVQATSLCPVMQQYAGIESQNGNDAETVTVYPNPSRDGIFTVAAAIGRSDALNTVVDIYNSMGERILHPAVDVQSTNGQFYVDLSDEAGGIYFMILRSGEQTVCRKLIKQ